MAHLTADENFWTGFKCEEEEGLAIKKNSEGTYLGSIYSQKVESRLYSLLPGGIQ